MSAAVRGFAGRPTTCCMFAVSSIESSRIPSSATRKRSPQVARKISRYRPQEVSPGGGVPLDAGANWKCGGGPTTAIVPGPPVFRDGDRNREDFLAPQRPRKFRSLPASSLRLLGRAGEALPRTRSSRAFDDFAGIPQEFLDAGVQERK